MGLEHGGQNSNVTFRIISGHDVQGAFCGADDDITWFFTVYSGLLVVVAEVGIYDCWAWRPARLEVLSRVETCNVDVVERRILYRMNYARFNAFLVKHCWQIERLRVLSGLPWREPDHFWRTGIYMLVLLSYSKWLAGVNDASIQGMTKRASR